MGWLKMHICLLKQTDNNQRNNLLGSISSSIQWLHMALTRGIYAISSGNIAPKRRPR